MIRKLFPILILLLAACAHVPLQPDDGVVLFRTSASLDADANEWVVPVHGWVYDAADAQRAFVLPFKGHHEDRRLGLMLANGRSARNVEVALEGRRQVISVVETNGHFTGEFRLPAGEQKRSDVITVTGAKASATVSYVPPEGVSIVSDIDDTVKVSEVLDRGRLVERTFFEPFEAVPGMADLLHELRGEKGAVHYLSASPWPLYEPLAAFLETAGFPDGSLHLREFSVDDSTLFDLLTSSKDYKLATLRGLLERYPARRFILIGDSGEADPEIYGIIARTFPGRIQRIFIRRAPGDTSGTERFRKAFAGLPDSVWTVFEQPREIMADGRLNEG